eukprot:3338224-Pyramimonas_sp.AAC.2
MCNERVGIGYGRSVVTGDGPNTHLGRGRPVLPAARRGALCPVDHPYRGPLLHTGRKRSFVQCSLLYSIRIYFPLRTLLRTPSQVFYQQLIAILTNAVERAFVKSPKFDMRQLLGGTAPVLQALI